ncbi:MAG: hypothetical protein IIZ42_03950, partial [Eubacterium sp.]|nr:hypothetical protein [Eubacterium sp.]
GFGQHNLLFLLNGSPISEMVGRLYVAIGCFSGFGQHILLFLLNGSPIQDEDGADELVGRFPAREQRETPASRPALP